MGLIALGVKTEIHQAAMYLFASDILTRIYMYMYSHKIISSKILSSISWLTLVEGDPKLPFSNPSTPMCREGCNPFPWIVPLTLDMNLIMLGVPQGSIKYHIANGVTYPDDWSCRRHRLHFCRGERPPPMKYLLSKGVLDMTLFCIWWWDSSSRAMGNVVYPFIAITPRFTLTRSGSTW